MSHEVKIHDAQIAMMRALLFQPSLRFADLQKESDLDSKHATFHIKRLVELGYAEKTEDGDYSLTAKGKEHANKLDTDTNTVERQPKVSVILILERQNEDGEREHLFQQRLKNPFFGYWARLGGKVRWGESLEEAAKRELLEETGLDADFEFSLLFHKRDFNKETKEVLEDKMFMVMSAKNITGDLMEEFEGGRNQWMTKEEFVSQEKSFDSAWEFQDLIDKGGVTFAEREYMIEPADY